MRDKILDVVVACKIDVMINHVTAAHRIKLDNSFCLTSYIHTSDNLDVQ